MSAPVRSIPKTKGEIPDEPIFRLSVAQYHDMIRKGILTDADPVELLDGWLVAKMSKNPPHRIATRLARKALEDVIPEGWTVDSQDPITLSESEPEPDLAVVRGGLRDFTDINPGPSDVALVIEVSDSTLTRNLGIKKHYYAAAGLAVYWVVNLVDRQVEVFEEPGGQGEMADYRVSRAYILGERIELKIEGRVVGTIAVSDLMP